MGVDGNKINFELSLFNCILLLGEMSVLIQKPVCIKIKKKC